MTRFNTTTKLTAGVVLSLALALGCGPASETEGSLGDDVSFDDMAPLHGAKHPDAIKGEYIVVFKDDIGHAAIAEKANQESLIAAGAKVDTLYAVIPGFSAQLSESALNELRRDPDVSYVEQNRVIHLSAIQDGATWGIDRADQRLGTNNQYNDYDQDTSNVHAYVIDTGVLTTHNEFTGRVGNGFSAIGNSGDFQDCHGHGTHVAGTILGSTYGLAKQATIHAVRVLDCNGSGTLQGVVNGVNWVAQNYTAPAVANMSLGGSASQAIDDAVANMVAAGVFTAVAAGNDNANACNYSPARVSTAMTAGATASSDARASFSNYGACTDIFAPGQNITSAWIGSNSATNTISGTSMASPHTAGTAALYLANNPGSTPSETFDAMIANATHGQISNVGSGSPNRFIYANFVSPDDDPGNGDPGDPGDPNDPGDGDSCVGSCGGQAASGCWCDLWCIFFGDCCDDRLLVCPIEF